MSLKNSLGGGKHGFIKSLSTFQKSFNSSEDSKARIEAKKKQIAIELDTMLMDFFTKTKSDLMKEFSLEEQKTIEHMLFNYEYQNYNVEKRSNLLNIENYFWKKKAK